MAGKRIKQTKSRARRGRGSQPHTKKYVGPRTLEEFSAMPERKRDIYTRVTQAVTKMKEHVSLRRAARELGLDPRTVKRIGGSALRRNKSGRFAAKASDRLLRVLVVLTHGGKQEIAVRDSRQASLIAEHWNAADRYLSTGEASAVPDVPGQVDHRRQRHKASAVDGPC